MCSLSLWVIPGGNDSPPLVGKCHLASLTSSWYQAGVCLSATSIFLAFVLTDCLPAPRLPQTQVEMLSGAAAAGLRHPGDSALQLQTLGTGLSLTQASHPVFCSGTPPA